jgi:hypothetical protein
LLKAKLHMRCQQAANRTPWDALVEVLSTWRLVFPIFASIVALFLIVYFPVEPGPGRRKLAVKVVDIFGNDTMTIVEVSVGGKK